MQSSNYSDRSKNYQRSLAKHGESPKSLQWYNYRSAANRYRELVADIDIQDTKILDAGCGMGDLLPYLLAESNRFEYLGVDITPEFIDIASKRYAGFSFEVADPFAPEFEQHFDIILSSGVLNANMIDWQQVREQRIAKLFSLCSTALVFNMAGGMSETPHTKKIAYADSLEVLRYCSTLTSKVILRNHYHSQDFTIAMFK